MTAVVLSPLALLQAGTAWLGHPVSAGLLITTLPLLPLMLNDTFAN